MEEATMTSFHSNNQSLGNDLVGSISLLNASGIPNLLWGNYLLTIYGVPTIVHGIIFVVPDTQIEPGLSALSHAGFLLCTQTSECSNSNAPQGLATVSPVHLNDELVISLYEKSDMLSDFPDFDIAATDSDILSASDAQLPPAHLGRGRGRFPPYLSAVRVPSAVRYCEAIIFLLCREYGTLRETYWMAMLTYLLEYVDETALFSEEHLREGYSQFYRAFKEGDPKTYQLLETIRDGLIARQHAR